MRLILTYLTLFLNADLIGYNRLGNNVEFFKRNKNNPVRNLVLTSSDNERSSQIAVIQKLMNYRFPSTSKRNVRRSVRKKIYMNFMSKIFSNNYV